jgi:hypothetical protein
MNNVYSNAYLLTLVLVIYLDYSLWLVFLWCIVHALVRQHGLPEVSQLCLPLPSCFDSSLCYGSINRPWPIYHQVKSPCHTLHKLTGPPKGVWMLHRRKKFPASQQELNPNSSIIKPVSQSLYLLNYATGSCQYLAEMQLHRHGKLTCTLCVKRHLWIWHRPWCTHNVMVHWLLLFFLGPVCISSGSTSAFKAYCALYIT